MLIADKVQVNLSLFVRSSLLSWSVNSNFLSLLKDGSRSLVLSKDVSRRRWTTKWICLSVNSGIISEVHRVLINGMGFILRFVAVDSFSLLIFCPQNDFFKVLVVFKLISFDYWAEYSFLLGSSRVLIWLLSWWISGLNRAFIYWNLWWGMIVVSLVVSRWVSFGSLVNTIHVISSHVCSIIILPMVSHSVLSIPQQPVCLILFRHPMHV